MSAGLAAFRVQMFVSAGNIWLYIIRCGTINCLAHVSQLPLPRL